MHLVACWRELQQEQILSLKLVVVGVLSNNFWNVVVEFRWRNLVVESRYLLERTPTRTKVKG